MAVTSRRAAGAAVALLCATGIMAAPAAARTTPPTTPAGSAGTEAFADPMTNFTPDKDAKPVACKPADGPLKAAWVYVGPINDGGWTQAHDAGRQAVQEALGDKVVTTYKENVPEGPQVSQVIDDLVKDGNTDRKSVV